MSKLGFEPPFLDIVDYSDDLGIARFGVNRLYSHGAACGLHLNSSRHVEESLSS